MAQPLLFSGHSPLVDNNNAFDSRWLDCNLEDMSPQAFDELVESTFSNTENDTGFPPSNQPSSHGASPSDSFSQGNTQLTPSSGGYMPGDEFDTSSNIGADLASTYSTSPNEADYENIPHHSGPSSSFASSDDGWSFVQPHGRAPQVATTTSASAYNDQTLTNVTIPIRPAPGIPSQSGATFQPLQTYAPTGIPGIPYHQHLGPLPQQPFLQFMPQLPNGLYYSNGNTPIYQQQFAGQHMQPAPPQHPAPPPYAVPAQGRPNAQQNVRHDPSSPDQATTRRLSPPRANLADSTRRRFPEHPAILAERLPPPPRRPRALAPATNDRSAHGAQSGNTTQTPKKGGRKTGTQLNPTTREKSARTRRVGACWRCRFQRDTCDCPDDGSPCTRCMMAMHKGQQYYFACDRSKLPDFVFDFLPPSFTVMHSKQSIEDCVKYQVHGWDFARPVQVDLTSGFGPPLRWVLYEFTPATRELLGQYQYLQNVNTRTAEPAEKWSPPLGITKLDPSDDCHFKNYLDELMQDGPLNEFGWTCFEEESQFDDFQATMLTMICELYQNTNDDDLKFLLQRVIRMLMVTYIMGHTLTITDDTLPMVHGHLRNNFKPAHITRNTSPRLANRQLKFFFHVVRYQIMEDVLKWQQATLHSSGGKTTTWLSTFIVMLAFAMVLEELQRTIQMQADTKARKGESPSDEAQRQAFNACERIDERFTLLVGLFQCKYRDRKWTSGSFGPQTPRLDDPVEHDFCETLRELVREKRDHLRSRKDMNLCSQNQCFYTSRLVARFLLPFLDLPG